MKTLRIAQAALATILAMGINTTTYAFMSVETEQPAEVQMSLTDMVDSLREEITVGETSREDMLTKLDLAVEGIDDKLDAGVANEEEYLAARDAIIEMRNGLEHLGDKLVQFDSGLSLGDPSQGSLGNSSVVSSGGGTSAGGAGAGGSGLSGLLVPAGIAGGAVAAGTSGDSSNPGFVASESFVN